MSVEDTLGIQILLTHFANSFDLQDWDGLQTCLMDQLYTDYSDLRGTPPQTVRATEYVQARRVALENLKTHHLGSNIKVQAIDLLNAVCRVSMVIWRKAGGEAFTTHCLYTFKVAKIGPTWKISAITQKVPWNEGQSSIHSGVK